MHSGCMYTWCSTRVLFQKTCTPLLNKPFFIYPHHHQHTAHTHTRSRWEEEITLNLVSGGVNAAGCHKGHRALWEVRWGPSSPPPPPPPAAAGALGSDALVADRGWGRVGCCVCVCGGGVGGSGYKGPFVMVGASPLWKTLMPPPVSAARQHLEKDGTICDLQL